MATASARKSGGDSGGGHPMLTGILIGLVAGVGISAAVAVWIARMPSPFQNRAVDNGGGPAPLAGTPPTGASTPAAGEASAPPANSPEAASSKAPQGTAGTSPGPNETPGNVPAGPASDAPSAGTGAPIDATTPSAGAGAVDRKGAAAALNLRLSTPFGARTLEGGTTFVQVGAFASEEDALKQVETVAQLTGARARLVPSEGSDHPMYRVRVGPFARSGDYAELVEALRANGISSSVVRVSTGDAPH